MAQFVPLEIDTGSDEWQSWARKYRHEGEGIPIVYVVRADGEMLYGKSGALSGNALPQLLAGVRQQAGPALSPKQFDQLTKALEKANQALEEGDIEEAVLAIAPVADSGSYAQAAADVDALAKKLIEQAQASLAEAEEKLASDSQALAGAVELAELTRVYRALPEAKAAAAEVAKKFSKDADKRPLFTLAAMVDKGKALEQQKQARRALDQYQLIVARHPGTPVAELAQNRIEALEAAGVEDRPAASSTQSRSASTAKSSSGGDTSEADQKAASSHLRLAKTFARTRPEKARDYAQKVLDLVPGTELAREAEALIAGLPEEN